MRLVRVLGRNWCQHLTLDYTFSPAMTAILGPNGSGKSNLLGLLSWTLTGENPNAGVKTANVSQLAGDTRESWGELHFEHFDIPYVVRRHVLPERRRATLHQGATKIAEGDDAVTAEISRLLQLDVKVINRFVIVRQGDIHGFIDDRSSEVDKFFQRLFDTTIAGKTAEVIGKYLGKFEVPVVYGLVELEQQIQQDLTQLQLLQRQLTNLLPPDLALDQQDYQIINQAARRQQLESCLPQCRGNTQSTGDILSSTQQELQRLEVDLQTLQDAITVETPGADSARAALANWQMYQQLTQQRDTLLNSIATVEGALTAVPVCQQPPNYCTSAERSGMQVELQQLNAELHHDRKLLGPQPPMLQPMDRPADYCSPEERVAVQEELRNAQYEIAKDRKFLQDFKSTGVAECPTCHTPAEHLLPVVPVAESRLAEFELRTAELVQRLRTAEAYDRWFVLHAAYQRVAKNEAHVASATKRINDSTVYETAVANGEQSRQLYTRQLQDLRAQLSQLQLPTAQAVDREVAQAAIASVDEYRQEVQKMLPTVQKLRQDVVQARTLYDRASTQLSQVEGELNQLRYGQADAAAATARIESRQQAVQLQTNLREAIATISGRLPAQQEALAVKQAQAREAAIRQPWAERLDDYRAICAAAPQFVSQHNLQLLQHDMNDILQVLQFDFRVEADQGLSFTARFYDGRAQPAVRLSNGQKVGLALAFRVAVNSMFAARVGLLALDEPTAWLDKERVRALAPVLQGLRDLTVSRGLQCVIVTHEDELSPLFDSTIQL